VFFSRRETPESLYAALREVRPMQLKSGDKDDDSESMADLFLGLLDALDDYPSFVSFMREEYLRVHS
jgi:hypothetical protein